MNTQDRIDVMVAIDRFCEMATNHPTTPNYTWGKYVYFADRPGQKVTRIVMAQEDAETGRLSHRSVHCFVDNLTGDVFKAAGWKAPAKGVRYNLLTNFGEVERNFDWAGGYLYADYRKV